MGWENGSIGMEAFTYEYTFNLKSTFDLPNMDTVAALSHLAMSLLKRREKLAGFQGLVRVSRPKVALWGCSGKNSLGINQSEHIIALTLGSDN